MVERQGGLSNQRYGYNGKEMDNDVSGTGNQYDYGFRIYNPRLGKFLSVDPLTKTYPMLTPYQFASNTPIRAIDLDGREALFVTQITNPTNPSNGCGDPGKAIITIQRTDYLITAGENAVNPDLFDTKAYHDRFSSGNTTLMLKTLPSPTSPAVIATEQDLINDNYYIVTVQYNMNLIKQDNFTIDDYTAMKKSFSGVPGGMCDMESIGAIASPRGFSYWKKSQGKGNYGEKSAFEEFAKNENVGDYSPTGTWNMIWMSHKYFDASKTEEDAASYSASATAVAVHGAGHTMADVNVHSNPFYKYEQFGLQSNSDLYIKPSTQNTLDIINDESNRVNITTGP